MAALELKITIFKDDNELWNLGMVINLVGQRLEVVVSFAGNKAEMTYVGACRFGLSVAGGGKPVKLLGRTKCHN